MGDIHYKSLSLCCIFVIYACPVSQDPHDGSIDRSIARAYATNARYPQQQVTNRMKRLAQPPPPPGMPPIPVMPVPVKEADKKGDRRGGGKGAEEKEAGPLLPFTPQVIIYIRGAGLSWLA